MAPRLPRRPRAGDDDGDEPVHLDDEAHAWWAQRPAEALWSAHRRRRPVERPPRDVMAEHFGPDWRTTFGLDRTAPTPAEPGAPDEPGSLGDPFGGGPGATGEPGAGSGDPAPEEQPAPTTGPVAAYAVLGVDPGATWEEIVAAHRAMARRHHPDRVATQGPEAVAAAEERIRVVNAAFAELRVRRGR